MFGTDIPHPDDDKFERRLFREDLDWIKEHERMHRSQAQVDSVKMWFAVATAPVWLPCFMLYRVLDIVRGR